MLAKKTAAVAAVAAVSLTAAACSDSTTEPETETQTQEVEQTETATEVERETSTQVTTATETATEATTETVAAAGKAGSEATAEYSNSDCATAAFPSTCEKTHMDPSGAYRLVPKDVRAGDHDTFDRVVFEFSGPGMPGWTTRYTDEPLHQASGLPLEVADGTHLEVMVHGTPWAQPWPEWLNSGYLDVAAGGVKNIYSAGAFEGESQWVIDVERERPYFVYTMDNPTRLVIEFSN
jgi:hypothetical protein